MKGEWKLLFFEIDRSSPPINLGEMTDISPTQAAKAVLHTALYGGMIEIYLSDDPDDAPAIGFVFTAGMYQRHGLGDDHVLYLDKEAKTSFKEPPVIGRDQCWFDDAPSLQPLVSFFVRCLQAPHFPMS